MVQSKNTEPLKVLASKDGDVMAIAGSAYSEQEISEDREEIIQVLHAAYLQLLDDMEEFQQQWDADHLNAVANALGKGAVDGSGDWGKSIGDLFDKETWVQVGEKVKHFGGKVVDTMVVYSAEEWSTLVDTFHEAEDLVDHSEETLGNWAWWEALGEKKFDQAVGYGKRRLDEASKAVVEAVDSAMESADRAAKLYKYRNEILDLPNLVSESDVKGIQHFVDTVLMDIDPQLARSMNGSEGFQLALELIADHDTALNYVVYLSLMIEAVPPNFYLYTSSKFGIQVLLEVLLTIVCAFLTAGTGVAVRVSTLSARLLAASARATSVARRIKKAQLAVEAYVRMIEDFFDVSKRMEQLARKLRGVRTRGTVVKGQTKQTLSAKRELVKRDSRCRLCGSTEHTTPRGRLGMVVYD